MLDEAVTILGVEVGAVVPYLRSSCELSCFSITHQWLTRFTPFMLQCKKHKLINLHLSFDRMCSRNAFIVERSPWSIPVQLPIPY